MPMDDRWKSADYAAMLLGAAAMLMFFFNRPTLGPVAERIVCFALGAAGLVYLAGGIWMWLRRRIEFDWLLVKGPFLRKVVCLVTLLPFTLTSAVLLCGLDAQKMLVLDESAAGAGEPSVFWTVFYHIIDPGNQHMTGDKVALGWTALLAVVGILLLGGLLVSTLINWFDRRREQWLGGRIRYGERQFVGRQGDGPARPGRDPLQPAVRWRSGPLGSECRRSEFQVRGQQQLCAAPDFARSGGSQGGTRLAPPVGRHAQGGDIQCLEGFAR